MFDDRISEINSRYWDTIDPFTISLHLFDDNICDTNKGYCNTNPTISLRAIRCCKFQIAINSINNSSCYALKLRQQSTLLKAQRNLSENHRPLRNIYFKIKCRKCWTPLKPMNKRLEQTSNNEHIQRIAKRSKFHMNVFIVRRNATTWHNMCRYDRDHVYAFHPLDSRRRSIFFTRSSILKSMGGELHNLPHLQGLSHSHTDTTGYHSRYLTIT